MGGLPWRSITESWSWISGSRVWPSTTTGSLRERRSWRRGGSAARRRAMRISRRWRKLSGMPGSIPLRGAACAAVARPDAPRRAARRARGHDVAPASLAVRVLAGGEPAERALALAHAPFGDAAREVALERDEGQQREQC